jgi:FG-GAP repeat
MKPRKFTQFSRTLSAVALALTTFTAGTASAAVLKTDFNNDGYEDLVAGSQREDVNRHADAGAVAVF